MFPVFVDNIPNEAEVSDLRQLFSNFGDVLEVTIVSTHGFVNYKTTREALDAIRRLNGSILFGSKLIVEASQELLRHLALHSNASGCADLRDKIQAKERSRSTSYQRMDPGSRSPESKYHRRQRSPSHDSMTKISRYERSPSNKDRQKFRRGSTREKSPDESLYRRTRSPWRRKESRSGSRDSKEQNLQSRSRTEISRTSSQDISKHRADFRSRSKSRNSRDTKSNDLSPISSPSPPRKSRKRKRSKSLKGQESDDDETHSKRAKKSKSKHKKKKKSKSKKKERHRKKSSSVESSCEEASNVEETRPSIVEKTSGSLDVANGSAQESEEISNSNDAEKLKHLNRIPQVQVQRLYVGNLCNPVEKGDVENLMDSYGKVLCVTMFKSHAIVSLEASVEKAEEAINDLDHSYWMDNHIVVRFQIQKKSDQVLRELPIKPSSSPTTEEIQSLWTFEVQCSAKSKSYLHDIAKMFSAFGKILTQNQSGEQVTLLMSLTSKQAKSCREAIHAQIYKGQKISVEVKDLVSSSETDLSNTKDEKKVLERTLIVYCPTRSKTFVTDMNEVVFPKFGTVRSCQWNPDGETLSVVLYSSELDAVRCISETNNISYKNQPLRVKFASGSLEDTPEFRRQYLDLFRNYPTELRQKKNPGQASTSQVQELPIGVLPPSSSLGAFGALPGFEALASIIKSVQMATRENSQPATGSLTESNSSTVNMLTGPVVNGDPSYFSNVVGQIHAVSNKIVLVKFFDQNRQRLAKFIPGQMYINGKQCLGYVIKNNLFHTWPSEIRSFLQQGFQVKMDASRLSEWEEQEVRELTSESVSYSVPTIWRPSVEKPTEHSLTVSRTHAKSWVLKGVLVTLYPKWGVLRTASGDVFFEFQNFYVNNGRNTNSLLNHLALGDVLATHCYMADYLKMTETARNAAGFSGATDTLKFVSRLVWNIHSEIDPYSVDIDSNPINISCQFLATSSTLNFPLPQEREAHYTNLYGTIEELYLPSGGIVFLDPGTVVGGVELTQEQSYVYFHKSRVYLNGSKIQTNMGLEASLVPGDRVAVDVIANEFGSGAYVASQAYWIALVLRAVTTDRGISIANLLRMEGSDSSLKNVCLGRIIQFKKPDNPHGPVVEGVAVIDSGEFAGQRVEFERSQCQLFGNVLGSADLSQIFSYNEVVYIQVKNYNSFLVEKLWIGSSNINRHEEGVYFRKYLFDHGIDELAFRYLVKGKFPNRPFIPLPSQAYRGKIRGFSDDSFGNAITTTIEAINLGEPLLIEASREDVYVFGHSMSKADLRYILSDDEITFEIQPVFDQNDDQSPGSMPKANLVWVGDQDYRPCYQGQGIKPVINANMDSNLWNFVRSKDMDEKMFRALVEGRLPPKLSQTSKTVTPDVDSETLAQAALLKQMKERFGPKACLKAMMLLMQESSEKNNDANGVEEASVEEAKELAEKLLRENTDQTVEDS